MKAGTTFCSRLFSSTFSAAFLMDTRMPTKATGRSSSSSCGSMGDGRRGVAMMRSRQAGRQARAKKMQFAGLTRTKHKPYDSCVDTYTAQPESPTIEPIPSHQGEEGTRENHCWAGTRRARGWSRTSRTVPLRLLLRKSNERQQAWDSQSTLAEIQGGQEISFVLLSSSLSTTTNYQRQLLLCGRRRDEKREARTLRVDFFFKSDESLGSVEWLSDDSTQLYGSLG